MDRCREKFRRLTEDRESVRKEPGWEFTKLLKQIRKIFLNFKVLLQSGYLQKIGTL